MVDAMIVTIIGLMILVTAFGNNCPNSGTNFYEASSEAFPVVLSATEGNMLKGFAANPSWSIPPYKQEIPSSLEYFYLPLSSVMIGENSFDFAAGLEPILLGSSSRSKHAILRFYVEYPDKVTGVPAYLIDAGLAFNTYTEYGGGSSPDYSDQRLIDAFVSFATEFGKQYDGDKRIAVVQVGLVGFWGAWHTYPHVSWMPSTESVNEVITAFDNAFDITALEIRQPIGNAASSNIGYHDDSFGFSTLDGKYNSGSTVDWFFWPTLQAAHADNAWRHSPMGGELQSELQATVFDDSYGAPAMYKQDLVDSVAVTHATYMVNHHAFAAEGYTGTALTRANEAALKMGYTFVISHAEASIVDPITTTACSIFEGPCAKVSVSIQNIGVAPFYYPLVLQLDTNDAAHCTAVMLDSESTASSVQGLQPEEAAKFTYVMSGSPSCLSSASVKLESSFAFSDRPVKLAHQYDDNGGMSISLGLGDCDSSAKKARRYLRH